MDASTQVPLSKILFILSIVSPRDENTKTIAYDELYDENGVCLFREDELTRVGQASIPGTVPFADWLRHRSGSVDSDHVPDGRSTKWAMSATFAAPLLGGARIAHTHVAAHVQHTVDASFIAN